MAPKIPTIAIVGRPNVGKSTLFNRVLGERKAIVEDFPGVTRDRIYALVERFEVPFVLVDTGGIETESSDELGIQVREQALIAAEEADLLIVMFDGADGVQTGDREVVELLRKYDKPTFFVVNKCDGDEQALRVAEFYDLGVPELHDLSALHGRRVNSLIGEIIKTLPNYEALRTSVAARRDRESEAAAVARTRAAADAEEERTAFKDEDLADDGEPNENSDFVFDDDGEGTTEGNFPTFAPVYVPSDDLEVAESEALEYERTHKLVPLDQSVPRRESPDVEEEWEGADEEEGEKPPEPIEQIRVAIVGRPNVGKSTLLNTLTGEQRAITSPLAGTTRDNLDAKITREGQGFVVVDTAGLRKKGKITDSIERYSTLRAIGALAECDVAVMVIDAESGPTDQDAKIIGLAHERGVGIVIAVNKWDLVTKTHTSVHAFTEKIRTAFKFAPYAPIVYMSALSGRRCPRVIEEVKRVAYERNRRVSTGKLNQVLKRAMKRSTPSPYRGREIKLYYATQVDVAPPRFALFFNYPRELHFSFLRYLKNALRDEFRFEGTEMKLHLKRR